MSTRAAHLIRHEGGHIVCGRCVVADSALSRMRGLLGRRRLERGEGLLLRPAGSIHTAFMRFSIDALFLDRDGVVVRIVAELGPWRTAAARRARAVIELPAGECALSGVRIGDRLALEEI